MTIPNDSYARARTTTIGPTIRILKMTTMKKTKRRVFGADRDVVLVVVVFGARRVAARGAKSRDRRWRAGSGWRRARRTSRRTPQIWTISRAKRNARWTRSSARSGRTSRAWTRARIGGRRRRRRRRRRRTRPRSPTTPSGVPPSSARRWRSRRDHAARSPSRTSSGFSRISPRWTRFATRCSPSWNGTERAPTRVVARRTQTSRSPRRSRRRSPRSNRARWRFGGIIRARRAVGSSPRPRRRSRTTPRWDKTRRRWRSGRPSRRFFCFRAAWRFTRPVSSTRGCRGCSRRREKGVWTSSRNCACR